MQPGEHADRADLAAARGGGLALVLAHGAALLLRATAIALLAAPLLLGIVLLLG